MPSIRCWQVDAFTNRPFAGNPAAICWLEEQADSRWMQSVASEMNLSEQRFTALADDPSFNFDGAQQSTMQQWRNTSTSILTNELTDQKGLKRLTQYPSRNRKLRPKISVVLAKIRLRKNHRNFLLTPQDLAIKIPGDVVFPLTSFP